MIGQHGRFVHQPGAQGNSWGIELGQVQLDHIMLAHQAGSGAPKRRRNHPFANP